MKRKPKHIEIERLNKIVPRLIYNNGKIFWKDGQRAGNRAGTITSSGYRVIKCPSGKRGGFKILEHIVIWFIVYGNIPENQIDHINGNRADNRPENLREVTARKNAQNAKCHREGHIPNTTKVGNKWRAQAHVGGKHIHFGYFNTQKEAFEAAQHGLNHLDTY